MAQFADDAGAGMRRAGGYTGRSLVLFEEGASDAGMSAVQSATGLSVATATDTGEDLEAADAVLFERLGVAVISTPPERLMPGGATSLADDAVAIRAIEPERMVWATDAPVRVPPLPGGGNSAPSPPPPPGVPGSAPARVHTPGGRSAEYLQGYRDAVLHLTDAIALGPGAAAAAVTAAVDETQATWGLQAVRAVSSCHTGRGIRVAVLDTGFDSGHPDFAGRTVTVRSFVAGQDADDGHGHGTHCIGTATGPKCVAGGPRYGIAHDAEIFAGKVLSNQGSGSDSQILAGINWAVEHGCAVISMSLGAATQPGQAFSQVFEQAARRALAAGTLLVAAAGNDSERPAPPAPVNHPANCPSILAVAAVDVNLQIAPFSNRGINPDGGQVDIAGPGVDVLSSWPMPTRYRRISGTSMATPHAAGVAALLAEANPAARGAALGTLLTATSRRLADLPSADVGAGLVQAP